VSDEPTTPIPTFEGKLVHSTSLRLASTTGLDIEDRVLKVDDIIHVLVDARVSQVNHIVDERTGKMERVQSAKVLDVTLVPWNPEDPEDEGVLRED
jgi:hypothetical protein